VASTEDAADTTPTPWSGKRKSNREKEERILQAPFFFFSDCVVRGAAPNADTEEVEVEELEDDEEDGKDELRLLPEVVGRRGAKRVLISHFLQWRCCLLRTPARHGGGRRRRGKKGEEKDKQETLTYSGALARGRLF